MREEIKNLIRKSGRGVALKKCYQIALEDLREKQAAKGFRFGQS